MADMMRFGYLERILLGMWVILATAFMGATLNAAYPGPTAELVLVFKTWGYIGLAVAALLIVVPALRFCYGELFADRMSSWLANHGVG